jgi:Mn2+/Fe2+ NRAMP family transporter
MVVIQDVAAEIGSVAGRGIAHNLRRHYSPWLLRGVVALLLIANIINLGADLGAMGAALDLLIGGPGQLYTLLFGVVCIVLEVWLSYPRGTRSRPGIVDRSLPNSWSRETIIP